MAIARWVRPHRESCVEFAMETLEAKRYLAGNVAVTISNGSLLVSGDDASNSIVIDQEFLSANEIRIASGQDATTINGQSGPIVLSGFRRDIRATLNGGSDRIVLDAGLEVPRDVRIDGANGSNTTIVDDARIGRNVFINNMTGLDRAVFDDADVGGQIRVHNGDGGSDTEIIGQSFVRGKVDLRNGSGVDRFTFTAVANANVSIINGGGQSETRLNGGLIEGNLRLTNQSGFDVINYSASVRGNVTIRNGDGDSQVTLSNGHVGKNFTLSNGNGFDFLDDFVSQFHGNASISNGDGATVSTFVGTSFDRGLRLSNGSGSDEFLSNGIQIQSNLKIDHGIGDTLTRIGGTFIDGNLDLRSAQGHDNVQITYSTTRNSRLSLGQGGGIVAMSSTTVGQALTVSSLSDGLAVDIDQLTVNARTRLETGAGNDFVTIDDSMFFGSFQLNTSDGRDVIFVDRTITVQNSVTVFNQRANFSVGSDDDLVVLGDADAFRTVEFHHNVRIDGGQGVDVLSYQGYGNFFAMQPVIVGFE